MIEKNSNFIERIIDLILKTKNGEIVIKVHNFEIKDVFVTKHYKTDELAEEMSLTDKKKEYII